MMSAEIRSVNGNYVSPPVEVLREDNSLLGEKRLELSQQGVRTLIRSLEQLGIFGSRDIHQRLI